MTTQLTALAKGLTEAQRNLMVQLRARFSIHPGNQTLVVREFLREAERKGLLTNPSFDNYFLTPLGLALHDHLKEQK